MKERQNRGEYKNIKNFKIYLKQYEIAEASDAASFIQFPSLTIPCINVNGSSQCKFDAPAKKEKGTKSYPNDKSEYFTCGWRCSSQGLIMKPNE